MMLRKNYVRNTFQEFHLVIMQHIPNVLKGWIEDKSKKL